MLGTLTFIFAYPIVIVTTMFYFFDVHSKVKLLFINLFFSCLNYYLLLEVNDYLSYLILSLCLSFWMCIEKRKVKFNYFAVAFFLVTLHPLTNKAGIAIISIITKKDILYLFEMGKNASLFFGAGAFGNMIMIVLCYLFVTFFKENQTNQKKSFSLLAYGAFFMIMFLAISSASDSLKDAYIEKDFVAVYLMELIFLMMFSVYLYYEQIKANKRNLEISNKLMTEEYHKQMFSQMNYMNRQISSDKHMILYHLLKINQLLSANKVEEATTYVNEQIHNISSYEYLEPSYNPLFDEMITKLSNELKENKIESKIVMSIEKENLVLNSPTTLELLQRIKKCILEQKEKISLVEFFFEQTSTNVKMKVVIYHDEVINLFPEEFYRYVNENYTGYFESNSDFDTLRILL